MAETIQRVKSAEFQKRFGLFKEAAQRNPITITSHGRDSLVLMSAQEYARLQALDTRRAYHPAELPDQLADALMAAEPARESEQYNSELTE